jgi:putative methionine-R-sulfoxide reductase with GAF domain
MDSNKKRNRYQRIYIQREKLLKDNNDPIANQATITGILHNNFDQIL